MKYMGNFFSLPNEIFLLGLCAVEFAVYSFLRRCEDHKTQQCWPSIRTIGRTVGMSENTVRKYIRLLEERGLIVTENRRSSPKVVLRKTAICSTPSFPCMKSHGSERWTPWQI